MRIRQYQSGDEAAQARVFNAAAAALPAYKPASTEEVARRYCSDPDPQSRFYAVEGDEVVGYAVFNPNGRVSYPWCLPGFEAARGPLLSGVIASMTARGLPEAWVAYRADWSPLLAFFAEHGFAAVREMVNFIAEVATLPRTAVPPELALGLLDLRDLPRMMELGGSLFADVDPDRLGGFFWGNPLFQSDALFALREDDGRGSVIGVALAVVDSRYADPAKLDAAMPCFRLGAMGTENERHKRVNGMFSCVFADDAVGEVLLAEAARRFEAAGIANAAAQIPSNRSDLVAFYDRYFRRQGAFPILGRRLG
jgi:hypothetical protein